MWTKAFILQALENALTTGLATFAASPIFTGAPSIKGLIVSATAAGIAALYTFVKQLGGVQAIKASAVKK